MTSEPVEMELGDEPPTALYRLYTPACLLYIGITDHLKLRFKQHARTQPWWPEVTRKMVMWYLTRDDAEAAETAAILAERPLHNVTKAGRWWRKHEWRLLPVDDEVGVDRERLKALALDKNLSPIALKMGGFYLAGRSTEDAIMRLEIGKASFFRGIQQLRAGGHIETA